MPTQSAAFERFRFSFFEDPDSAHQGLDTPALAGLAGEKREQAEGMLFSLPSATPATTGVSALCTSQTRRHMAPLS